MLCFLPPFNLFLYVSPTTEENFFGFDKSTLGNICNDNAVLDT